MNKQTRPSKRLYDVRLITPITRAQYIKLAAIANAAKTSMSAIVRLLISDAK